MSPRSNANEYRKQETPKYIRDSKKMISGWKKGDRPHKYSDQTQNTENVKSRGVVEKDTDFDAKMADIEKKI